MQPIKSRIPKGLNHGSYVETCDNSGAKVLRVISVKGGGSKGVAGKKPSCGVGDLITASVRRGTPEMRKQVVFAVVVRQRMPFRRPSGERVRFEDNAAVVLKDESGSPKGTLIKGAIPREVAERWPMVSKLATIIV
ncbi:50S ribosomal protein L14 [Candidatus Woesearchaeota archaeon]|nr:50S ribosomal protein L14 [Candidatus Woesearchaeota archaeon]